VPTLELTDATLERCEALGLVFLARFFEVELSRRPENDEVLAELGHLYTRLGRYTEGLAVDQRLVVLHPEDPTARYNLACSLALTGDLDGACDALGEAFTLGFDDGQLLREDPDLAALHGDPRFDALLAQASDAADSPYGDAADPEDASDPSDSEGTDPAAD